MSNESYRDSHSHPGYGRHYAKTYKEGYYYNQWLLLEVPFLKKYYQDLKKKENVKDYLDFACGTGRILALGQEYFQNACGIDISATMLEVAKENCPRAHIIQGDLTKQSIDKKFDLITAFRFFVNAEDELKASALTALYSHLRPGGILIANIHQNKNSPLGLIFRLLNTIKGKQVYHTMSLDAFCALLEDHHFKVEDVFWYSFLPRPGHYFSSITSFLLKPFDTLIKSLPFLPKRWAQSFIVIARKL